MRESLPAEVAMLVGGCALPAYRDALEKIGAVPIENPADLLATAPGGEICRTRLSAWMA